MISDAAQVYEELMMCKRINKDFIVQAGNGKYNCI